MVKAIVSSPLVRKFAATTMLTTAVIGANAKNLKTESDNSYANQTEWVSKEVASAIKVRSQIEHVPAVQRNKKLDKLLINTCENHKDTKSIKSDIEAVYKVFGTCAAMIELQRDLDDHYIEQVFEAYKGHYSLSEDDCEIAEQVFSNFLGWKDNVYYTELFKDELKMYEKTRIPSAEDCLVTVDKHIKNSEFFKEEDEELYNKYSKRFIEKQEEKESVQAKLDLISYKIHLLNSLAFNNYFRHQKPLPKNHIFLTLLSFDFINGDGVVKP